MGMMFRRNKLRRREMEVAAEKAVAPVVEREKDSVKDETPSTKHRGRKPKK